MASKLGVTALYVTPHSGKRGSFDPLDPQDRLHCFTRSQVHWGSLIEIRVSYEPLYAKLSHFGEVLHSKSLGFVPNKLNTTKLN